MARPLSLLGRIGVFVAVALILAACSDAKTTKLRGYSPIPEKLVAEMQAKGMTKSSPILVRVYKQEAELEIWKQNNTGRFALLKTYPICRWSGQLGPKRNEGDRQVPEGFYSVSPGSMNPNSRYYLSYDFGYPNAFDQANGRSGGNIMVHGACSSRGCFSMTDAQMAEIYAVTREAFAGGQASFQAQSFPFRMTAANLTRHRLNPNMAFWKNLKEGSDNFEVTKRPVDVAVCAGRYVFNGQGGSACGIAPSDPALAATVAAKQSRDAAEVAALVSAGRPAVAEIYNDGGAHPSLSAEVEGAIPGQDRPFTPIREPIVVALDESGAPATPEEARKASIATFSAADTLLASEAAVSRRAYRSDPAAVAQRQRAVYARIFGDSVRMTAPVAIAKAQPKVEPTITTASVVVKTPAAPSDTSMFANMLGGGDTSSNGATVEAVGTAEAASTVGKAPSSEQPFYSRWLWGDAKAHEQSEPAGAAAAASADVITAPAPGIPVPPRDPRRRTAALPDFMLEGIDQRPATVSAFAPQ